MGTVTVLEDASLLATKLEKMMEWLHLCKDLYKQRMLAYEVLPDRANVRRISMGTDRLLHHATVAMASVLNPRPRLRRPRPRYIVRPAPPQLQNTGFVLPEMANYL